MVQGGFGEAERAAGRHADQQIDPHSGDLDRTPKTYRSVVGRRLVGVDFVLNENMDGNAAENAHHADQEKGQGKAAPLWVTVRCGRNGRKVSSRWSEMIFRDFKRNKTFSTV